jgi:transcriptional regulator with XRE-family HTH domain
VFTIIAALLEICTINVDSDHQQGKPATVQGDSMARTPKQAGKKAPHGGRYPSEAVAENIRSYRAVRRLSQEELAERMNVLGHGWYHQTVGEVERGNRAVTVDELIGLALALEVTVGELLDPMGPAGEDISFYFGDLKVEGSPGRRRMSAPISRLLAHSKTRIGLKVGTKASSISVVIPTSGPHVEEVLKAIGRPVRSRRKR